MAKRQRRSARAATRGARITRARQNHRYGGGGPVALNARLPEKRIREYCGLGKSAVKLLIHAQKKLRISARGRSHILRVARTIADLEGADQINGDHISEAVQYRKRVLGP